MELRAPKYEPEPTVYVPEGLVTMIAEHVRLSRAGDDPERWLFEGARDDQRPAHAATVARWRRLVHEKAGIEYRLHDSGTSSRAVLIAAGCDVVTVERALGHSSP